MSPSDSVAMPAPAPLAFQPARIERNAGQVECFDNCFVCSKHWRRPQAIINGEAADYKDLLDDRGAEAIVKKTLMETLGNSAHVNGIVNDCGDHLIDKWRKMPRNERKAMLLDAQSGMYQDHGFPVSAYLSDMIDDPVEGARHLQPTFSSPSLTLENLVDHAMNMMLLIRSRTAYGPAEWVSFDSAQHNNHFEMGVLEARYSPRCVVMEGDQFGALVPWNEADAHSLKIMGFPRALLALEAGLGTTQVARSVVDSILRKYPLKKDSPRGRVRFDALTSKDALPEGHLHHPAFSAPPSCDLAIIFDSLQSRYEAVVDELQQTQTEPDALGEMLAMAQHVPDSTYGGKNGKDEHLVHLALLPTRRADAWQYLMVELEASYKELKKPVSSGGRISQEYDAAFSALGHVLRGTIKQLRRQLSIAVASFPNFVRTLKQLGKQTELRGDRHNLYNKNELLFHLVAIAEHEGPGAEPLAWHCREIFRLSEDKLKRVDQLTMDLLADLIAVDGALTSLRAHRPRCSPFQEIVVQQPLSKHALGFNDRFIRHGGLLSLYRACPDELSALQKPLGAYLDQPAFNGDVSKNGLDTIDKRRAALEAFLSKAREHRANCLKATDFISGPIVDNLKCVSVFLTEGHKRRVEAEREAFIVLIEKKEASAAGVLRPRDPNVPRPRQQDQREGPARPPGVAKEKTVGIPAIAPPAVHNAIANDLERLRLDERAPIEVSKTSLQTLGRLFDRSPHNRSNIRWNDFRAALKDVGFVATTNGGSEVSFRGGNGYGTIVIHKPHPEEVMRPMMCKFVANRLGRRFGWTAESFLERPKPA
ncbi:unnamed protein product [Zymoseptoria tritici ST99CH_3D7]|uniref:Type II toxin-antitoxin system HicA family toxin n=1 Tax=Zymoseptoria tritici (strain ST99CH_3D7) TaxID=1276538 RepID=A0A1X7RIJ5_ZYMT9|nr:unnamed protein product [Zymoseptoria tritici ST99CH_3D7]